MVWGIALTSGAILSSVFPATGLRLLPRSPSITNELEGLLPCDIYEIDGTPCVAAHSTTRALFRDYDGPLYAVSRASDNKERRIPVVSPGGVADSAQQDQFCAKAACTITRIFDQSSRHNDLSLAPYWKQKNKKDKGVKASKERLLLRGHPVYAAFFEREMGYRIMKGKDVPVADEPETMYMVVSGRHYNKKCCFDYGNAENITRLGPRGSMEAIYYGADQNYSKAPGHGPWIMADLEGGVFAGDEPVPKLNKNNTPIDADYVTTMLKGRPGGFTLKGGDAQNTTLRLLFDGGRPRVRKEYQVMKKEGSIVLGVGGDNSWAGVGTFYEGAIVKGYTRDSADAAVQRSIASAGYGRNRSGAIVPKGSKLVAWTRRHLWPLRTQLARFGWA